MADPVVVRRALEFLLAPPYPSALQANADRELYLLKSIPSLTVIGNRFADLSRASLLAAAETSSDTQSNAKPGMDGPVMGSALRTELEHIMLVAVRWMHEVIPFIAVAAQEITAESLSALTAKKTGKVSKNQAIETKKITGIAKEIAEMPASLITRTPSSSSPTKPKVAETLMEMMYGFVLSLHRFLVTYEFASVAIEEAYQAVIDVIVLLRGYPSAKNRTEARAPSLVAFSDLPTTLTVDVVDKENVNIVLKDGKPKYRSVFTPKA